MSLCQSGKTRFFCGGNSCFFVGENPDRNETIPGKCHSKTYFCLCNQLKSLYRKSRIWDFEIVSKVRVFEIDQWMKGWLKPSN
jgi:hypothetical protein